MAYFKQAIWRVRCLSVVQFHRSRSTLLTSVSQTILIVACLQQPWLQPEVAEALRGRQQQRQGVLQQQGHQHLQQLQNTCEAGSSLEFSVSEIQLTRMFTCSSETPHLWPEFNAEQQLYCSDETCSTKAPLTGATLIKVPETSTYFLNVSTLPIEPQKWKFFCAKEPWSSSLVHDQKCTITVDVIPATSGNCYHSGGSVEVAIPAGGGKAAFNCGLTGYSGLQPADPLKAYDADCNAEIMLSSIIPSAVRTAVQPETGTPPSGAPYRTFNLEVMKLPPVPGKICYLCTAGNPAAAPRPPAAAAPQNPTANEAAETPGETTTESADTGAGATATEEAASTEAAPENGGAPQEPTTEDAIQPEAAPLSYISLIRAQAPGGAPLPETAAAARNAPATPSVAAAAPAQAGSPAAQEPAAANSSGAAAAAARNGGSNGTLTVTSSPEMRNKACRVYATVPSSAGPISPHLLLTTSAILIALIPGLFH